MKNRLTNYYAIGFAILAAALFGMSAPFSKLLLDDISPIMMASLVYLGAGLGMLIIDIIRKITKSAKLEARLTKEEMPYILAMILLDILAPISLMIGLTTIDAASAALLNNFEIVATSLFALFLFKEAIPKRLWLAIFLIIIASVILSTEDITTFTFSVGSMFVLLACIFWGIENNCTRMLSIKDPLQVVIIKGLGAGSGSLIAAFFVGELSLNLSAVLPAMFLGFFAYGMSIFFYVSAQRHLGAARTSTYYSIAPFIGVGISFFVFDEPITLSFVIASLIMIVATYFVITENHQHGHSHTKTEHEHRHNHNDGHHNHKHQEKVKEHSHLHIHDELDHAHEHTPDLHHMHEH